jgi:hypothetical protein
MGKGPDVKKWSMIVTQIQGIITDTKVSLTNFVNNMDLEKVAWMQRHRC